MAWKIPVAVQIYQWDTVKKQFPMMPLPDFVSRVSEIANPTETLMVMCRSGGRSAIAVNMLANTPTGDTYTFDEIADDLRQAGFVDPMLRVPADDMNAIVAATRPTG